MGYGKVFYAAVLESPTDCIGPGILLIMTMCSLCVACFHKHCGTTHFLESKLTVIYSFIQILVFLKAGVTELYYILYFCGTLYPFIIELPDFGKYLLFISKKLKNT